MKILSIDKIREADRYTIEHEPIRSVDLMERAAGQVFEWLMTHIDQACQVKIFCGTGNNGGDGLVVARRLYEKGFEPKVFMVGNPDKMSPDCKDKVESLQYKTGIVPTQIHAIEDFPALAEDEIIIDALFGSGLNRPIEGVAADLIEYLNRQQAIRIVIDIASGLFADTPSPAGAIFKPDYTLTFQQPKLAFLMPENDTYVGQLEILDIQLHPQYLLEITTNNFFINKELINPIIHKRTKYSHKGAYGHALLIAGSEGKTGAAILGAKSCLRTGVGLLSVLLPKVAWNPLMAAVPEAMLYTIDELRPDRNVRYFDDFGHLDAFNAIGVGPGLGKSDDTQRALKRLIQESQLPLVMDADALNILSENPTWLSFLPSKTILTPHPKEFERLFGKTSNSFERLELLREKAMKYGIIIVLKGAHTAVAVPNGAVFFNSTGNPGMATAGSGDVLTGMILSLLAQRYAPEEAAVLGVYLHGLAGDLAAAASSQEAMIASDITENIGNAYTLLK